MGVTMATAYLAPVHPPRSGPLPPPPHPPPSPGSQTRRGRPRSRPRLPRLRGPGLWSSALKRSARAKTKSAETGVSSTSHRGPSTSHAPFTVPFVTFTRDFLFFRGPSMQSVAIPWKSSSSSLSSSSSSSQPCRNGILSSTEPPRRSLELSLPAFLQMQHDIKLNDQKREHAVRSQKSEQRVSFGKFLHL